MPATVTFVPNNLFSVCYVFELSALSSCTFPLGFESHFLRVCLRGDPSGIQQRGLCGTRAQPSNYLLSELLIKTLALMTDSKNA